MSTLTRQHFRFFAEFMKARAHEVPPDIWAEMVQDLCRYFSYSNDAFNRDKFIQACMPKVKK